MREGDEGRQVFVSNLPYRVSWQDLKDLFRNAGVEVVRADVMSFPDGKSKGMGTVLFATEEDAKKAIYEYNDYDWEGRKLVVRLDRRA